MKIPEYNPQNLASSAVGTPGVNTAGQQIGEDLAGTLDKIATVQRQKNDLADSALSQTESIKYDIDLQEKRRVFHEGNIGSGKTPQQAMVEWEQIASKLKESHLKNIKSQGAKQKFNEYAFSINRSSMNEAYKDEQARQSGEIVAYTKESMKLIYNKAGAIGSGIEPADVKIQKAEALLPELQKAVELHGNAYTDPELKKLRQSIPKQFAESLIYGALNGSDPQSAIEIINSKEFDDVFDLKERADFITVADRAIKNRKIKLEAQNVEMIAQNRIQTITALSTGEKKFDDLDINEIANTDPQLSGTLMKVKDFMGDYNPKVPVNEQPLSSAGLMNKGQIKEMKNYAKSITGVFMNNDNESLAEFIRSELDKKGDGLTSGQKIAALANLALLKSKANNPKTQDDMQSKDWLGSIKEGLNYLESSSPYLYLKSIGDFMIKNYLGGYVPREAVLAQAKEVLRDKIVDKYKAVSKLPSTPNKIVDGERAVEDLQSGRNELEGEPYNGSYGDTTND